MDNNIGFNEEVAIPREWVRLWTDSKHQTFRWQWFQRLYRWRQRVRQWCTWRGRQRSTPFHRLIELREPRPDQTLGVVVLTVVRLEFDAEPVLRGHHIVLLAIYRFDLGTGFDYYLFGRFGVQFGANRWPTRFLATPVFAHKVPDNTHT